MDKETKNTTQSHDPKDEFLAENDFFNSLSPAEADKYFEALGDAI